LVGGLRRSGVARQHGGMCFSRDFKLQLVDDAARSDDAGLRIDLN
jgi:hypothetical protein